jgi:hypothetical protein
MYNVEYGIEGYVTCHIAIETIKALTVISVKCGENEEFRTKQIKQ